MDSLDKYREIIKNLIREYALIKPVNIVLENEVIFDEKNDHYLLLSLGWNQGKRIHDCIIHIDIIGDKVWIQVNNTDQLIAQELIKAGISPQSIVLGLQPPEVRPLTAYAIQ